jgi:hypothetical protein
MSMTPFFRELRSAYQAEMDDLTFDSEGKDVLRQRLAQRRKELPFLLQMLELSPEMVAVVFHQGFRFMQPSVMHDLLTHESDEFPEWDQLAAALTLTPPAQELAKIILQEPMGAWFMTVAAGLEFMYSTPDRTPQSHSDGEDEQDKDADDNDEDKHNDHRSDDQDDDEDGESRAGEEAGADWMVEQGFDRKD